MKRKQASILIFIRNIFNLSKEQEERTEIINSIEKGVDFKGRNIWALIFAIFIASIGLNVNSAAAIIGAMLISPLMGPIMGLGLSVGIYDFTLLKRSLKNLVVAVIISVITSYLYFLISPLSEAQSELLSRTTPTIYDVLIALFGGLAGIVAGTSKDKGNAIPGVAIATALMPPLCTAGYGLATGNLMFFIGAFYLFFINAVMISLSTFLIVRFLKFPFKQEIEITQSKKVRTYIYIIVTITIIPSFYFAYHIVKQTIFNASAVKYVSHEFVFDQTQVIHTSYNYNRKDSNSIVVLLSGKLLNSATVAKLNDQLVKYSLFKTKLVIKQGNELTGLDLNVIKDKIVEDIFDKSILAHNTKDEQIDYLNDKIRDLKSSQFPNQDLAAELNAINPKIYSFSVNQVFSYNVKDKSFDTIIIANVKASSTIDKKEAETIRKWLEKRIKKDSIKFVLEN
jgi:uncharacterized hydrophobic protein (TIGR00271 family)